MRRDSTVVLPEPAPAMTASNPADDVTARRCAASSRSSSGSASTGSRYAAARLTPWSAPATQYSSPMPYPRKLLNADETIAVDLHPHWWYFAEAAATLIGSIILAVIALA